MKNAGRVLGWPRNHGIAAQQPATQQARGLSLFKERLGKQQPKQQPIPEPRVESPDKREAEPEQVEAPKVVERAVTPFGACSPGTTDGAT